jgi:hypothetical protein
LVCHVSSGEMEFIAIPVVLVEYPDNLVCVALIGPHQRADTIAHCGERINSESCKV